MLLQLRNIALSHFDTVDLRTVAALEVLHLAEGLTDDDTSLALGEDVDIGVLLDPAHERRIGLPPGPLVVYLTEDEPPRRVLVEVPVLLYSDLAHVREAAFNCLSTMVGNETLQITPKTSAAFESCGGRILGKSPSEWRRAAIELCDALFDDVLVSIQGARQSLNLGPVVQDSLTTYLPLVFHPSISSLDSISMEIRNPEAEHAAMEEVVARCAGGGLGLADALSQYFDRLGHLPLAPGYSLAEVASRWMTENPETDVWAEVWGWAHGLPGPLPKYHACSVFLVHPELVPEGQLPALWDEILAVAHDPGRKDSSSIEHESWSLRRDLTRHFAFHLEAHLPDGGEASIACFSWWLSERVASLFPDNATSAKFYRENLVAPTLDRSAYVWLAAFPRVARCFLRYATATVSSPWGTALLALMGPRFEELAAREQSDETRARFHECLVSCLIGALPFTVESPTEPTYAQKCGLGNTALKWAAQLPEAEQKPLEQLVATSESLGSSEGLCAALRELGDSPLADQVAVTLALKAKAYTDPTISAGVWEILSDSGWRERVLGTVEEHILGSLIEAFSLLEVSEQDEWLYLLPHYLAELCESTEDDERRRQLFLYVVHTSLASDTASAVRRLLHGSQKANFVDVVREYRERVEGGWSLYPPWVRGRLRGLLSALHVT